MLGARYPGEADLHQVVVRRLLPALLRRKESCRLLLQLQPWQELATAFAGQAPGIRSLGDRSLRWLARSLVLPAGSLTDAAAISQYLHQLVGPIVGEDPDFLGSLIPVPWIALT